MIFFFLFPGEKYCEIVQEQSPVSTVMGISRSFQLTRSTVREPWQWPYTQEVRRSSATQSGLPIKSKGVLPRILLTVLKPPLSSHAQEFMTSLTLSTT